MVRVPVKMIPGIFIGLLLVVGFYYFHILDNGYFSNIVTTVVVLVCPVLSYLIWEQVEKRSHSKEYKARMKIIDETRKVIDGLKKQKPLL